MDNMNIDIKLLADGTINIGDFMALICEINDESNEAIKELDAKIGLACIAKEKAIKSKEKNLKRFPACLHSLIFKSTSDQAKAIDAVEDYLSKERTALKRLEEFKNITETFSSPS